MRSVHTRAEAGERYSFEAEPQPDGSVILRIVVGQSLDGSDWLTPTAAARKFLPDGDSETYRLDIKALAVEIGRKCAKSHGLVRHFEAQAVAERWISRRRPER